jgi:hypothetical protein
MSKLLPIDKRKPRPGGRTPIDELAMGGLKGAVARQHHTIATTNPSNPRVKPSLARITISHEGRDGR